MPRIIIEASPSEGAAGERTFSERIVTQNLQSGHYSAQLLERLIWAVADAEAAEGAPAAPAGAVTALRPRRAQMMDSLYFG
jgi:hypothetical protein